MKPSLSSLFLFFFIFALFAFSGCSSFTSVKTAEPQTTTPDTDLAQTEDTSIQDAPDLGEQPSVAQEETATDESVNADNSVTSIEEKAQPASDDTDLAMIENFLATPAKDADLSADNIEESQTETVTAEKEEKTEPVEKEEKTEPVEKEEAAVAENFENAPDTGKSVSYSDPNLFDNNTIVAYYGHPNSKVMGIVGRYSKTELAKRLVKTASAYDKANGTKGAIPAFYIIYGTCQPEGNIGRLNKKKLKSYIDFALEHNFLIYIDHQIGKYAPSKALAEILPYLKYPNVNLAIDVEWRTTRPMKEIGHITAAELNGLQKQMHDYMVANNIQGKRQLVFHQFHKRMVTHISDVKENYNNVILVHSTSGWGRPALKKATHARNAQVTNIPYKGFKLWYFYSNRKGIHYDKPLMSPTQVLGLTPEPGLVIYQ